MLVTLAVWCYVIQRFPLRYDPLYWGAVFPLGMYSVATQQMASALDLPFLSLLPHVMFAAALTAWTVAFGGLLFELGKVVTSKGR
jgi:tellurite resistance protein TehA-like permease